MTTQATDLSSKQNEIGHIDGPISLRESQPNDRSFLLEVYTDSRFEELQQVSHWSEQERSAFLQFQFEAQDKHYREHYPDAQYLVIQLGTTDIGRLYIEKTANEIRIMDIAILHAFRRRGIAQNLIKDILDEASSTGRFVGLHVEPDNVAKILYTSLGFKVVGEISFYEHMEWRG